MNGKGRLAYAEENVNPLHDYRQCRQGFAHTLLSPRLLTANDATLCAYTPQIVRRKHAQHTAGQAALAGGNPGWGLASPITCEFFCQSLDILRLSAAVDVAALVVSLFLLHCGRCRPISLS